MYGGGRWLEMAAMAEAKVEAASQGHAISLSMVCIIK